MAESRSFPHSISPLLAALLVITSTALAAVYFKQLQSTGRIPVQDARQSWKNGVQASILSLESMGFLFPEQPPTGARTRPISTQGDAPMPASRIATVSPGRRSQFLDGLTPTRWRYNPGRCNTTAILRQFRDHKPGSTPPTILSCPRKDSSEPSSLQKRAGSFLFQWLGPGDQFGRSDGSVGPSFLSLQHRSSHGQLGVGVGSPHNLGSCRALSQVARERIVNCVRLRGLASRLSHRFSLPHLSTAGCSCTRYSCPDYRYGGCKGYCTPDHKRGVG